MPDEQKERNEQQEHADRNFQLSPREALRAIEHVNRWAIIV